VIATTMDQQVTTDDHAAVTIDRLQHLLDGQTALAAARLREIEHLREEAPRATRIEAAARRVLATGQGRYHVVSNYYAADGDQGCYVGDLVPAEAMRALRAAVEGKTAAAGRDGCARGEGDHGE